jgi:two-component system, chemotaxis family, CheB/CheR fusion protein
VPRLSGPSVDSEPDAIERATRRLGHGALAFLESAGVSTFVWDLRTRTVLRANGRERAWPPAGAQRLDQLLAQLEPADRQRFAHQLAACLDGTDDDCTIGPYRVLHPGRPCRWFEDHGRIVRDQHGYPVHLVGITIEVSPRMVAEESLKLYRAVMSRALESRYMGTWAWDVRADRVTWEPELRDVLGRLVTDFAPTLERFLARVVPEDRARVRTAIARAMFYGRFEEECRLLCIDGVVRWFYKAGIVERCADGHPIRITGIFADQTDSKRAAEALRDSEQRFRALVEDVAEAVWEADAEGNMVFDSPSWRAFTGQSRDDFRGFGWVAVVHPDDRDRAESGWRKAVAELTPVNEEVRIRSATGEWRWTNVRAAPLMNPDCTVRKWVGMHMDITERRLAERERDDLMRRLAEARDAAEQASRTKSEFLANMSHELRTPMTAILGVVEIMLRQVEDQRQRGQLTVIKRNGEHLTTILNDILDLSRIEAGRLELVHERFSPVSLIEEVRALMQVRAQEKRLPLLVRYLGPIPARIDSDRTRVRQILVNLVGNAIKFTQRGHVAIEVQMRGPERDPRLELRVVDTGVGMEPEQVERLFAPFEQADSSVQRRFGGSGLGLGISRRLVDMLEGDIEVGTELGRGSTFSLILPAGDIRGEPWAVPSSERVVSEDSAPVRAGDDHRLEGFRILVADDQYEVRAILKDLLESAGGTVEEARDGLEALTLLQEDGGGQPIDAVLLDLQMPVLDGYETVRRLRARGDLRPVVAVTASAMRGDRERALAAGCDEHFAKPIDVDGLVEALGRLCRGAGNPGLCRVQVVDDDPDVLNLLVEVLANLGCEVHAASDAAGAVRDLDAGLRPHLALIDLTLPDLRGADLIRTLRAHPGMAGARLVAVSGHSEPEIIRSVREAGCSAYYIKPIDLLALENEVALAQASAARRAAS